MSSLKCKKCNKELFLYSNHYMGWEDGITAWDVCSLGENICPTCHRPSNIEGILRSKKFIQQIKND